MSRGGHENIQERSNGREAGQDQEKEENKQTLGQSKAMALCKVTK